MLRSVTQQQQNRVEHMLPIFNQQRGVVEQRKSQRSNLGKPQKAYISGRKIPEDRSWIDHFVNALDTCHIDKRNFHFVCTHTHIHRE